MHCARWSECSPLQRVKRMPLLGLGVWDLPDYGRATFKSRIVPHSATFGHIRPHSAFTLPARCVSRWENTQVFQQNRVGAPNELPTFAATTPAFYNIKGGNLRNTVCDVAATAGSGDRPPCGSVYARGRPFWGARSVPL